MTTPLPESAHVSDAVAHLRNVLHPQIYNHSVRTFLLGRQAALRDGVADLDCESLCLAALFHDSGTARPIAHYLRRRVEIEFGPAEPRASFEDGVVDAEGRYPRTDLEEILQTLVVEQALRQPQKATAPSLAADLVRNHQPGRRGVNPAF
jgi:hypothetical protein